MLCHKFRAYPLLHQHLIRTAPYGKWIILQSSCWIRPPLSGLVHVVLNCQLDPFGRSLQLFLSKRNISDSSARLQCRV